MNSSIVKKLYSALGLAGFLLMGLQVCVAQPVQVSCAPGNDDYHNFFYPSPFPMQCVNVVSDVPAATLLLPYFEVDTANSAGRTTVFTINNSSATSILAHVTLWNVFSVPVFNFNVYLTGFDTQIINLRDVLNGHLPRTATAGQDPTDTISPKGPFSQDINFASCNGNGYQNTNVFSYPRLPPPATLNILQIAHMQSALQMGVQSNPNPDKSPCAGTDGIARGYVTIDVVNNCTSRFATDAGYIGTGGTGDLTDQDNMTGEAYYLTGSPAVVTFPNASFNLVHIVADFIAPETITPGVYTFYGRYDGWNAADNRQPLATNFMARFMGNNPTTPAATFVAPPSPGPALIVWRDSKVDAASSTCPPSWYPLRQEGILAFDEQEHPQLIKGNPFPVETQMVRIGGSALPVTFTSGWLDLDLNTTVSAAGANPPLDPLEAQAWVEVVDMLGSIRPAQRLDTGTHAWHFPYPFPGP